MVACLALSVVFAPSMLALLYVSVHDDRYFLFTIWFVVYKTVVSDSPIFDIYIRLNWYDTTRWWQKIVMFPTSIRMRISCLPVTNIHVFVKNLNGSTLVYTTNFRPHIRSFRSLAHKWTSPATDGNIYHKICTWFCCVVFGLVEEDYRVI